MLLSQKGDLREKGQQLSYLLFSLKEKVSLLQEKMRVQVGLSGMGNSLQQLRRSPTDSKPTLLSRSETFFLGYFLVFVFVLSFHVNKRAVFKNLVENSCLC